MRRSSQKLANPRTVSHAYLHRTEVLSRTGRLEREGIVDLRDAAAYHQLVLNEEGASLATQRNYLFYERLLIQGFEELGIPLALESLATNNVRRMLVWYRQRVNQNASRGGEVGVNQCASRLKGWANFLAREEIIPPDALRMLRPARVAKILREPYTQAEVTAMWGACRLSSTPVRDEALFLLLLDTGMRIGEAVTLTLDRLRLDERQILVGARGKGRRERLVPLGDGARRDGGRVVRTLRAYLLTRHVRGPDTGRVFLTREGRPMSSEAGSKIVQRLGDLAGVTNPITHRLRHTFCTWYLVTYPGDELGLRRIVGHVSHQVLADYVHFAQSIIAERAGRASLSETWLGAGALRGTAAWGAPAKMATQDDGRTAPKMRTVRHHSNATDVPPGVREHEKNVTNWHCPECQGKGEHAI